MKIVQTQLINNFIKNTTDLLIRKEILPYVNKLYELIKDVDIDNFICYGCQDYPFLPDNEITNELVIVLYFDDYTDFKIEINPFSNDMHYYLYSKSHYVNSGEDILDNIIKVINDNIKLIK